MNQTVTTLRGPLKTLLFTISLLAGGIAQAAQLEVASPWVVLAPPGAYATAAFMELHNPGEAPVDVVGAAAPGFESVELHRSFNEDGMHRMVRQDRIRVPAGGSVSLAPGGLHIMLIGPERELEEGEMISIDLTLGDGSQLSVDAPVTPREKGVTGHHDHGHDHGHTH